jgi:hypothetical protein
VRVDGDALQGSRVAARDLLNVHAALRGEDH